MAFIVYERALQALKKLKPIIEQVRRHDPSLADQIQRAGQSIFLNIAEVTAMLWTLVHQPRRAPKGGTGS